MYKEALSWVLNSPPYFYLSFFVFPINLENLGLKKNTVVMVLTLHSVNLDSIPGIPLHYQE